MIAPIVEGIDLFHIAGRSISGWVKSFKMGTVVPVKQPFYSHLEKRLLLWLEYHPLVARSDIGPQFAATYRLPTPKHAPFTIGYLFESRSVSAEKARRAALREAHTNKHMKGTVTDGTPAKQAEIAGIEFATRHNHDNRAL